VYEVSRVRILAPRTSEADPAYHPSFAHTFALL
jgi:hypothetical protein